MVQRPYEIYRQKVIDVSAIRAKAETERLFKKSTQERFNLLKKMVNLVMTQAHRI
jgi:hypothetical protein